MTNATEQLGIDFNVTRLKDVLKGFQAIRREAKSTGAAFEKMLDGVARARQKALGGNVAGLISNAQITTNQGAGLNTSTSGGRLRIEIILRGGLQQGAAANQAQRVSRAAAQKSPWIPMGPRQMQTRLIAAMNHASATGNMDAYYDSLDAFERNAKRLQPKRVKTTGDRIMDLIYTSRFGVGGGKLSPLIGKAMDVAGGRNSPTGKALLGIGILGNAAIELAKDFWDLVHTSTDLVNGLTRFAAQTGGSPGENAFLRGASSASGVSMDDIAATTKALQQSITGGGMGQVYAAKAGVFNLPGAMGSQDWAKNEVKIISYLRSLWRSDRTPNHDETIKEARAMGQESLIPMLQVSPDQWAKNMKTAMNGSNGSLTQNAVDLAAAEGRAKTAFENLLMVLSGNKGVIAALNRFADFLDNLNAPNSRTHDIAKKLLTKAPDNIPLVSAIRNGGALLNDAQGLLKPKKRGFGLQPDGRAGVAGDGFSIAFGSASRKAQEAYQRSLQRHQEQKKASQDHIEALRKNTDATTGLKELIAAVARGGGMAGSYGNMTRQGVTPRGLDTGFILNKYLSQKALQLSSF